MPGDIKGFTFIDFLEDGDKYYGETTLNREIKYGIGPRSQITYGTNFHNKFCIGARVDVPKLPKRVSAHVFAMPWWFARSKELRNKSTVGYSLSIKLPYNLFVNHFGEWNLNAKGGKTDWDYGELMAGIKFSDFTLIYNPSLKKQKSGGPKPKLEHRLSLGYWF